MRGRVFDCFPFFNELDMLEMRLHTLYPVVDHFVIVEMSQTHQGNPKPLYFNQNKARFEQYLPKIRHVMHDYNHWENNDWIREHYHRDLALGALTDIQDNDIVMVSDVDEIPRPEVVAAFQPEQECKVVQHRLYNYYLNCYAGLQKHERGVGLKIASGATFKNLLTMIPEININGWAPSCTHLRYRVMPESDLLVDAGWHFSWQGGRQKVIEKLEAFAHGDLNVNEFKDPKMWEMIDRGEEPFIYGVRHHKLKYEFVTIDESFPPYLVANKQRFEDEGWIKKVI